MIAIVTDSTAYLTKNDAKAMNVHVVPMTYTAAGQLYNESYGDRNGRFEEVIFESSGNCTTAQGPVAAYMSIFDELIKQNYEVLCIVISSRLSGTYSSASVAAKAVGSDKIAVVDSLSTAGGLYLLIKKAHELSLKGLGLNEVVMEIQNMRDSIGIVFSVNKMDALRRSGRLGIVRQSVATILNFRPILMCIDGAVTSREVARGNYDLIKKMVNIVPEDAKEIIVHYLEERTDISQLVSEVRTKFPEFNIQIKRLGPVLGIHLGLGVIAVAWISE